MAQPMTNEAAHVNTLSRMFKRARALIVQGLKLRADASPSPPSQTVTSERNFHEVQEPQSFQDTTPIGGEAEVFCDRGYKESPEKLALTESFDASAESDVSGHLNRPLNLNPEANNAGNSGGQDGSNSEDDGGPCPPSDDPHLDDQNDVSNVINAAQNSISPTVSDLLDSVETSVRLSNIARNHELFGEWTLLDALQRREYFLTEVRRLPNAGAKTVLEVAELLDGYVSGAHTLAAIKGKPLLLETGLAETASPGDTETTNDILEQHYEVRVVDVLREHSLSVRVEHLLNVEPVKALRLRDFVLDREGFSRTILGVKNSGRGTLREIIHILTLPH